MPDVSILNTPLKAPPKRTRTVGNVGDARRSLWRAMRAAEDLLTLDGVTPQLVLSVVHALSQSAGVYLRLTELDDLAGRLTALERAVNGTAKSGAGG